MADLSAGPVQSCVSRESAGPNGWADDVPLGFSSPSLDLSGVVADEVDTLFLTRLAAFRHQCGGETGVIISALEKGDDAGRGKSLIPVTHVTANEMIDDMVQELTSNLTSQSSSVTETIVSPLLMAVSELGDNATTHGESDGGAWVSVRHGEDWCSIAVGDLGIGIPQHISKRVPAVNTDDDAILQAVAHGTTSGRGYGGLLEGLACPDLSHARLRIWSGAGRVTRIFEAGKDVLSQSDSAGSTTPGTWVSLALSSRSTLPN